MTEPTNAQLAVQITTTLQKINEREAQYRDWLSGSPTGGPNGDGRYPITNLAGETILLDCLARIVDLVDGPAGQSASAKALAEAARDVATVAQATSEQSAARAGSSKTDAENARDLARLYRDDAAADRAAILDTLTRVVAAASGTDENRELVEALTVRAEEAAARIADVDPQYTIIIDGGGPAGVPKPAFGIDFGAVS